MNAAKHSARKARRAPRVPPLTPADAQALQRDTAHATQVELTRSDFLAMIVHELRGPLAPIRQAAQILAARPAVDPTVTWCSDVIERQVRQMVLLLDDLQRLTLMPRCEFSLQCEWLDLRLAVLQAVETTAPLMADQGHRLLVDQPKQPVLVHGDLARLTQVFVNLLSNAAKYTPQGGTILLTTRQTAHHADVRVHDNGVGIADSELTRMFDLFVQLGAPPNRPSRGQGIGLALARRLAELHGGTVTATSGGCGQGSTFRVRLPAAPGNDAVPPNASPTANAP